MASVPATSIVFSRAEAPMVPRSCWLIEKIKELFRKIIAFFSPYTKVDFETRLSRLIKMERVEDLTPCLDFEVSHIAQKSRDGLEVLYNELKRFQAALVHVCAMKKLDPQKAEKIYEQLLQRFSEGDLLEAAFVEVRKFNKCAWEVGESLGEQKILSKERVNGFTTDLINVVAAKERKEELTAKLGKIISEQGDLFRLFQNLKNCYQKKEELLDKMSIKGLDQINRDIERLTEAVLMQKRRELAFRFIYNGKNKEILDLESRKEIERLELEKDVQGAWCDGAQEKLSQLQQQFGLKEAFVREACHFTKYPDILSHVKKDSLKKVGEGYQYIAKNLQRFLGGVKTRNN